MKNLAITLLLGLASNTFAGFPANNNPFLKTHEALEQNKNISERIIRVSPQHSKLVRKEDGREPHGPGLFANAYVFLPSNMYMNPYWTSGVKKYNMGYGVEVGNFFRFYSNDRIGIGLRATWLNVGYTALVFDNGSGGKLRFDNLSGRLVNLGPQFSILLNEQMGIDIFYQWGPHYQIEIIEDMNSSFLGYTHEVGAGFRYGMLNVGFGMRSGYLVNIDNSEPLLPLDDEPYSINAFRIFVGIQL